MTNTLNSTHVASAHAAHESDSANTRRLRMVLRANAVSSITGGLVALVAGSWISRELGIDHELLTRVGGGALIVFALAVMQLSQASPRTLLAESVYVSLGDFAWVVGTVALILTGVLTSTGNLTFGLVAAGVADFGLAQLWFRSKAIGEVSA